MEVKDINRKKVRDLVVNVPPSSTSSATTTPRALLRSLVRFPKYCIIRKGKKGGAVAVEEEEEEEAYEKEDEEELVGPTVIEEDENAATEEVLPLSSGRKPDAVSFNLGIGVSLVYLLVKSATEFSKMLELRKQMEILLKDIKCEMQRKNATPSYSESNNCTVMSVSNCWGDESTSNLISSRTAAYELCECETALQKQRCIKINQLEEELEAELERLHTKEDSVLPQQQSIEVDSTETNYSEGFSASFMDTTNEPKLEDNRENSGVCPRELERRLHELLETRQQERIAELESALARAQRKLQEKETEICWWKDTAKLVSKHKEVSLYR